MVGARHAARADAHVPRHATARPAADRRDVQRVSPRARIEPWKVIARGRKTEAQVFVTASAYRNLEVLEEVGLVRHVHLGHGPGLYHPAGREREFVVCESCGAVRAVAPAALDAVRAAVLEAVGYRARFTHFPLAGLCPACASKTAARSWD